MTKPRAPRVPFALLVTVLLLGGLGLLLALNTASAANELERHDLATRDQQVAAQVQQLRNEVALSSAPGNLARAAAALGMVPAGNPAFIVLGADGSATVLGKPKAVVGAPVVVAAPPKAKAKPTKTPSASRTPSSSKTPSPKTSSSKTPSSSRTSGRSTAKRGAHPSTRTTPKASPTPTPSPTPIVTLPGGNR